MELALMNVPVGNLICRVLKTDKYEFPQSVDLILFLCYKQHGLEKN
jgi:hypothetical protein